jgi:ankyrin repeat protein
MSKANVPMLKNVVHAALLGGDTKALKYHLDQGFSVDARMPNRKNRPQRETALMIAAEFGNIAMAKLLLARGADVNAEAQFQTTALGRAIVNNHPSIVNILLTSGAKIYPDFLSHAAIVGIDLRIARSLLRHGADPNAKNKISGQTAIHMAAFQGRPDVARLLIRARAYINIRDKHGHGPLSCAIIRDRKELFLLLLKSGADPKLQPEALGLAAFEGKLAYVKLLVESGWDLHSKAHQGRTALHHAKNRQQKSIVKILQQGGALR